MIFKTGFTCVIYISKTIILICVNLRCLRNLRSNKKSK